MKKNIITRLIIASFILLLNLWVAYWYDDSVYDTNPSNFSSTDFTINVSDFTPMWHDNIEGDTLKAKSESLLLEIIEVLMVSIWVISLLVVSIWAGYMIFYNWKEDFLTKWRNMIYTGLLALLIALSSFYIINLIRYILYN